MTTFWDCLGNMKSSTLNIRNSKIRKQNPKPILFKTPKSYVERSTNNSSNIKWKAWNQKVGDTDLLKAESYIFSHPVLERYTNLTMPPRADHRWVFGT